MTKKSMILSIVAIVLAAALAIGILVVPGLLQKKNEVTPAPGPTEEELIKLDLTVDLDDNTLDSLFPEISWEFLDSSMYKHEAERMQKSGLSAPVTFPFSNKKDEGASYNKEEQEQMLHEVYEEILRNPVFGDSVAQALVDLPVVGNETLGSMNPWMGDFLHDTDEAMKIDANDVRDSDGNITSHTTNGIEVWLETRYADEKGTTLITDPSGKAIIYVTKDYRRNGVRLCVLIQRLTMQGVKNYNPEKSWILNAVKETSKTRTEMSTLLPENLDSLIFSYLRKDSSRLILIGFNCSDKHIETFNLKVEPNPPKDDTPQPKPGDDDDKTPNPKPGNGDDGTPKPKPGDGDDGTPNPKPGDDDGQPNPKPGDDDTPDPKPGTPEKKPEDDPVNNDNGNADQGGGQNKPGDGGGPAQETDPANDSSGGHQKPEDTKPDTPAQDDQHPNPADNTDENKMPYTPDNQDQDTTWTDNSNSNHQETYGGDQNNNNSGNNNNNNGGNDTNNNPGNGGVGGGGQSHDELGAPDNPGGSFTIQSVSPPQQDSRSAADEPASPDPATTGSSSNNNSNAGSGSDTSSDSNNNSNNSGAAGGEFSKPD